MKILGSLYNAAIEKYQAGGIEIKPTTAIYKIGIATIIFISICLELLYLAYPKPFDFFFEKAPYVFIFSIFAGFLHFLLIPIFKMYNSYHEISDNHLISVQGLFLARKKIEHLIPYHSIMGTTLKQTIFGRIFNYGTIYVGTRMTGSAEVRISNIVDPKAVQREIDERR